MDAIETAPEVASEQNRRRTEKASAKLRQCPVPRKGDKRYGRSSRIRNGSAVISGVPQTSLYIHRLKELLADYTSDIPEPSTAESSILKRACILEIELEHLETKFAANGQAGTNDLLLYQRTAAISAKRTAWVVGRKREAGFRTVASWTWAHR